MSNPQSVKELFLPITSRLTYYYESGRYSKQASTHVDAAWKPEYLRNQTVDSMDLISYSANLYDHAEVCDEALSCLARVEYILNNLQDSKTELITYEDGHPEYDMDELVEVSEGRKIELLIRHKDELINYQQGLTAMIEARNAVALKKLIALPEEFAVKDLIDHFSPKLQAKQVAYLFSYLRELELIAKYQNKDLGRLAKALFGIGEDVRKEIPSDKGRSDRKALVVLQGEVKKLLNAIDKDLITADEKS